MTTLRYRILFLAVSCMAIFCEPFGNELSAQLVDPAVTLPFIPISPKTIRDSKGKDFWLGFPRNHHDGNSIYDRLYINIVTERATQGQIEYITGGQRRVQPFSIAANDIYTFELPYSDMELAGQGIIRNTFHITADEEVTVYGLSIANTTSDGFLAFPTDVLGREYVIASYPSNVLFQNNASNRINTATTTMSQFSMVAAYDSTVITITPTAKTWNGDSTTYSIVLNQGQGYLVSLTQTQDNMLKDFTGSRIVSSKPLVVYGGHERAAVPIGAGSRDCLIEQMLPVEVWGKTALVVPYPTPSSGAPDYGCDPIRVIAGYDNTVVTVNGTTVATLRAGAFYEMTMTTAASVVTSEPAIVAGYKCSARGGGQNALGDPFLAIIPPVEQFLTRYRFVCVQGTQFNGNRIEPAFQEHYVTMIVPTTKATTVVLDGSSVSLQSFRRIRDTEYSYASVRIGEGRHSISADTAFGITIAGYGRANSYGYIGGQRFETDIRPPQIAVQRSCTGISGKAFDSAFTDSKIFFYDTLRSGQRNIRFRFGALSRPADSLGFQADLINPYEDGALGLVVVDSLDLRTVQRVVVPGFTVHANPTIRTDAVSSTTAIMRLTTGRDYCFRIPLANYGATNQTVQSVGFAQSSPQFTPRSAVTRIEPNSTGIVEYCFRSDEDGIFSDTLTISNGCLTRKVLAIRIETGQDRLPPTVQRSTDSCNRTITLDLADNRTFDAGLAPVQLSLQNMTARQTRFTDEASTTDSTKRPLRITLTVTDPRADAVYALTATDSVGNVTTLRDTIPGFTARFVAAPDTSTGRLRTLSRDNFAGISEYRFTGTNATSLTCGTILIQNTGIVPFVLERSLLSRNLQFSLPPSQFPFIVPAGSSRPFSLCFNPALVAVYRDTMTITKFCITEQIILQGEGLPGDRIAGTRCDAVVRLSARLGNNVLQASQILQVRHFPDPAHDELTLQVNLEETQTLTVTIYSMLGVAVASLPAQTMERGAWDIALKLNNLETGVYYCEVRSNTVSNTADNGRWTGLVRVAR